MTYSNESNGGGDVEDSVKRDRGFERVINYSILVVALAVLVVGVFFVVKNLDSIGGSSGIKIVVFDTNKYVLSKRMAAAEFIMDGSPWRVNGLNEKLDEGVKDVLRSLAGDAVILDASAVIMSEQYEDITDRVLDEMGLPKDGLPNISASSLGSVPDGYEKKKVEKDAVVVEKENVMDLLP